MSREPLRLVAAPRPPALAERAARLWPDHPHNAREWLRAVQVVRGTRGGWLLDQPARRAAP